MVPNSLDLRPIDQNDDDDDQQYIVSQIERHRSKYTHTAFIHSFIHTHTLNSIKCKFAFDLICQRRRRRRQYMLAAVVVVATISFASLHCGGRRTRFPNTHTHTHTHTQSRPNVAIVSQSILICCPSSCSVLITKLILTTDQKSSIISSHKTHSVFSCALASYIHTFIIVGHRNRHRCRLEAPLHWLVEVDLTSQTGLDARINKPIYFFSFHLFFCFSNFRFELLLFIC